MGQENKRLPRGEEPSAMTPGGLSKLPKGKSVLGRLIQIVAQELIAIIATWASNKWLGARVSARGALDRQDIKNRKRPGLRRSSQPTE